jgi:hypothetical protein
MVRRLADPPEWPAQDASDMLPATEIAKKRRKSSIVRAEPALSVENPQKGPDSP